MYMYIATKFHINEIFIGHYVNHLLFYNVSQASYYIKKDRCTEF